MNQDLFLNGRQVEAGDGGRFDVLDPATGNVLAHVADATEDDAIAAVAAAHAAGPGWAATAPRRRAEILRAAFELMSARAGELAELISLENGKALADAKGEVAYAAEFFRWYAEEAVRADGLLVTAPSGANRIMVTHQPVGVCVLVTPWNFPAAMATRKIGPALAAGCTMVLKPASDTPLTALAIGRVLAEAGVPDGVVNVLPARRSGPVVSAMLHDPRVRKLSFTGSTEVGRVLLKEAADQVVNVSMELGGNAPFLVFADADLEAALDGAMIAKMRNAGEACTAANRFYVAAPIAAEFGKRLAERMSALIVGPGTEPGVEVGPLVNQDAVDKVEALVRGAVEGGAQAIVGGGRPDRPGFYYDPTVLVNVHPDAPILREEIFGPVAPIVTFDDEDEAVRLANDTEFGLVAYLYTGDLARGLRVAERLESGMVGLNRGLVSDPAAPFGGVKQSGIGREGGHEGMLDYLEAKYIAVSWD
ncbi:NAD-dependent succinate-semialdehyde dehydrogenase [Nonomuraea sp. NBC_01738]|uniref:NAD-dependent succinate-semialdehyde dehydrogenase n=1 Tax=Nonomuraea sp. NBC_01738 TaxID=2976003 RepID=UPI002E0FC3E1|nr:NAD-dependent succinate-semialdehyde dehydrogenase [Nonomuraea sp. NBC_01738]